jgi:hypothetical protein
MSLRYQIHDEDGLLRSFHTRADAVAWMLPGMRLVVLPRPKAPRIDSSKFEPALI